MDYRFKANVQDKGGRGPFSNDLGCLDLNSIHGHMSASGKTNG